MLVDALCHLSELNEAQKIIHNIKEKSIINLAGTHPEDWEKIQALRPSDQVSLLKNFGIHPWWVSSDPKKNDAMLSILEEHLEDALGLGEIGLDFYQAQTEQLKSEQIRVFHHQLSLAHKLKIPVIIHCVKAQEQCQQIIKQLNEPIKGIMHGFHGDLNAVKFILKKGILLSIGPHSLSRKHSSTITEIPLDRLLIESDFPQGNSRPYSEHLANIVFQVSELTHQSIPALTASNYHNLTKLYQLPSS